MLKEKECIKDMADKEWIPNVIIGRAECSISCSVSTIYRLFKQGIFKVLQLLMKVKREAKGHQERREKQAFKRNISKTRKNHAEFEREFGA